MSDPSRRIATYQDVLDAPEGVTAEILGGELFLSPRPGPEHAYSEKRITSDIDGPFERGRGGPGGWWILPEPELHLGDPDPTAVVASPDVAGWRRERMPWIPRDAAITVVPDWVCEVLSPGSANVRRDRVRKPDEYATAGIGHLWIVDPLAQTLEVFRLTDGLYARVQAFEGDAKVRAEPFADVELDLAGWWLPTPDDAEE